MCSCSLFLAFVLRFFKSLKKYLFKNNFGNEDEQHQHFILTDAKELSQMVLATQLIFKAQEIYGPLPSDTSKNTQDQTGFFIVLFFCAKHPVGAGIEKGGEVEMLTPLEVTIISSFCLSG